MVKHMIKAGYAVTVADIDERRLEDAAKAGATTAADTAAVGAASDYVIVAVGYDDETREVTMGERGLIGAMAPGSVIAVCSTAAPATVRAVASAAEANGIGVFDAPICRGRWAADDGTLLALVGGTDEVVGRSRPIFETFCSDIAHLGPVGHGQFGKAMNNFLMWINGVGLIEAGRLAEEFGADLPKLRDALLISSGKSAALEDWDRMTFTWALKDMQVVSELSDLHSLSLPITGAIKELVKDARKIKATNPPDWTGEGGVPKRL
jgi:3-hydroxyisobutyrate dehydrogenase/2-hydroxy-3-oxopropionate reductase